MKITLSNVIIIENPTQKIKDWVKKSLTFKNPDFEKKKRMGFYAYGTPKEIKLYDIYENKIYIPMGMFEKLWKEHPIKEDYKDYTITKPIRVKSSIVLREYQEPTVRAVKEHYCGVIGLKVGTGKTQCALQSIAELGQKTLFMAHTRDLVNQAKERCESNMECKTSVIMDGKLDTSGDIVFATVQTVLKFIENGELKQDEFGMIVLDECFPRGTKISTPYGYKNIEDIKMGDIVYSYNHEKHIVEEKKVNYLFNKTTDELVKIKLSNGKTITCTKNHPIYVNDKYIRADEIQKGDVVYELQSMWENKTFGAIRVESIEIQKPRCFGKNKRNCEVYNIGVLDNNNYFADGILVHNCQHLSTNPKSLQMFRTCFEYFAARYKIGLSAELHRADGLQECIKAIIGDIIYDMQRFGNDYVCIYNGERVCKFPVDKFQVPCYIKLRETNYDVWDKEVFSEDGGTIQFASLISDIAMNKERNKQIINDLKKMNGSTIILSDRVEQLKYLCSQVENGVEIDGSTPKKKREQSLQDIRNGKVKYLFASYQLAREGLDAPILSNLVMATPVKDFGIVVQSIGRIQRPYGDKKIAYVYDYVDDVGMLLKFYTKRRTIYRKNKWGIEGN